jgi:hypothetical protein
MIVKYNQIIQMSKKDQSANLTSEKTKDIRMTNIIAARGKKKVYNVQLSPMWCVPLWVPAAWTKW